MTVEISNIVIHQLATDENGLLVVHPRDQELDVTVSVEEMVQEIHRIYNAKPGKGHGGFNEEKPEFLEELKQMKSGALDFMQFSVGTAKRLVNEINQYGFEEQGYLLLADYRHLATEFLMVALVETKTHVSVTSDLNVANHFHLDLARLQLAARIDLTELSSKGVEGRCVSFVKGRAGRKVADFFLDCMGCEERVDAKQQNKELVNAVEDFMRVEQLHADEKVNTRKEVLEYCDNQLTLGEDIRLEEVSQRISKAETETPFIDFARQQDYGLEDEFPVDKTGLKPMLKFSGSGGGITLNFTKNLLGDRIYYDLQSDTLTIRGLPPNLRDQLCNALKSSD